MPRTADHDARREQILTGLIEVALREGLPRVTIPRVAAAAGISIGLVQHYFPTKDGLLAAAHAAVWDRIERRADAGVTRAEARHARIEHILADALCELIPLDEERRREWYLTRTFSAAALDDPELLGALVAAQGRLRARVAGAIANGRSCGEVVDDLDEHLEAAALLARVMGLADQAGWRTGITEAEVRRIVAWDCATVFRGPCTRELGDSAATHSG
ncbi:TetR/AcrR family transcriptional regulator [Ammonicoccus fulvus]|uniref:TetR/AcrR family transcriptional regulator n=1 Tax=Ammonicoccus fulvus TaxID=3138240 RepID=A0ABZ3FP48_9ACTN